MDFALADMQIINFNENRTLSAKTEPVNGRDFASGVYSSGIVQLFRALAISNDAKRSARLFEVEWCKIPPTTLDNIGDAVQGRADLKEYFHMNAHGSHPMSWWRRINHKNMKVRLVEALAHIPPLCQKLLKAMRGIQSQHFATCAKDSRLTGRQFHLLQSLMIWMIAPKGRDFPKQVSKLTC